MAYITSFRMKQLPKAEYQLMKMMIEHFTLDDPSELFTILLRLGYEVSKLTETLNGELWMKQIINQYRSNPSEQRTYEL